MQAFKQDSTEQKKLTPGHKIMQYSPIKSFI